MAEIRPEGLRWRLDDDTDDGQRLFAGFAPERHLGVGEYEGLEFIHVQANRILNRVPAASRMPFRWTINAYRGCSHACSYCLAGDTPILMGDGRCKPLADLRAGDAVYGTVQSGRSRRYVVTPVLDHWETVRHAWRVVLGDGTTLTASGDHRFLTEQGWKHVTGAQQRPDRRPHLSTGSRLIGTGQFAESLSETAGYQCGLDVVAIEDLGVELAMYDITTGTGDFIANGVVSHNCFARPTHSYLNLNIGEDFERKIVVKLNAVERLRIELRSSGWRHEPIAMGTNTDPYQLAEGRYHLTRGIVQELAEVQNPFSILTKSTLILRDLDLLAEANERCDVRLAFSVGTLDPDVWRLTEPGTPPPERRLAALRRLRAAGLDCSVLVAPVIPGLSDSEEQVRSVVAAAREAGASSVTVIPLHLRPGVREHYLGWLTEHRPDLLPLHHERFGNHSQQPKRLRERLGALAREGDASSASPWSEPGVDPASVDVVDPAPPRRPGADSERPHRQARQALSRTESPVEQLDLFG